MASIALENVDTIGVGDYFIAFDVAAECSVAAGGDGAVFVGEGGVDGELVVMIAE